MFIDSATIHVRAGDGGNGCLAFRREKFVPRGGPSGGDGGRGGDVIAEVDPHLNTLHHLRFQQHFKAGRGAHGSGSNRRGKDGKSVFVRVPPGTLIVESASGRLMADMIDSNSPVLLACGGRGGRGNATFKTATNQAPRRCEEGSAGEQLQLRLELKLLADVGLVGFPNAGKSTLISVLSRARPKIADYPFTTLTPKLGVVEGHDYQTLVVADVPGLIEGAHAGGGLGDRFLRHIERCKVLCHLVDVSGASEVEPVVALEALNRELELYSPELSTKTRIVVASKIDAGVETRLTALESYCHRKGTRVMAISSVSGAGLDQLKAALFRLLEKSGEEAP